VDDLALQVGVIDNVEIDDAERADTRSRKVKREGERVRLLLCRGLCRLKLLLPSMPTSGMMRWRE